MDFKVAVNRGNSVLIYFNCRLDGQYEKMRIFAKMKNRIINYNHEKADTTNTGTYGSAASAMRECGFLY